jgi:hypothetical protein
MKSFNAYFCLVFTGIFLTSCFGAIDRAVGKSSLGQNAIAKSKSRITEDGKQIPPNFSKEKTVLLVVEQKTNYSGYKKYIRELKKIFEENYFGAYEFVPEENFNAAKIYQNTSKYRYIFALSGFYSPGSGTTTSNTSSNSSYNCIMYDRIEKTNYSSVSETFYGPIITGYLRKLEEIRMK